jgi:hypothetical protein
VLRASRYFQGGNRVASRRHAPGAPLGGSLGHVVRASLRSGGKTDGGGSTPSPAPTFHPKSESAALACKCGDDGVKRGEL